MNKIIEVIKKAIGSENEVVADFVPFVEGEKIASQPEETLSQFKMCINEICAILNNEEFSKDELTDKIKVLEEIHNKRIKNLKEVLKEQTIFYKEKRNEIKEKQKEKNIKIPLLETEIKNLKDAIKIYGKLEKKYSEAMQEIERLNKMNESQRSIILKSSYKSK